MVLPLDRRVCTCSEAGRRYFHLQPAAMGIPYGGASRTTRNDISALDCRIDERYVPQGPEVVSGALCLAVLHQRKSQNIQPCKASDSAVPTLQKGRLGLRGPSKVS